MITKKDAWTLLPRVGDKLRKTPTTVYLLGRTQAAEAQECEVVEVNRRGLWFRVQFPNSVTECYKVPESKLGPQGGICR